VSEEGKTADGVDDSAVPPVWRSPDVVESSRFTTATGRALTPRELVRVVLHVPALATDYARELFRQYVPLGAR
jgi:hypothetical protein